MSRALSDRLRMLRATQSRVQPDEAWVRATRATILMQAANSLPTEQLSTGAQVKQVVHALKLGNIGAWFRTPLVATLSVFAVLLGGSAASVSAAEQALPGDFLYSLKLATEQARLAMTSLKEDKLKLKIEFTSRRGDELKRVVSEDMASKPARVEQTAEILKRDLNTVKQQLEEVKAEATPKMVVEVAKLVDHASNQIVQQLQETKAGLSDDAQGKVIEAQAAAADAGVKAIEVIVEQHKESHDVVSASDVVDALQAHTKTVEAATGVLTLTTSTAAFAADTGTSTTPLDKAVQDVKEATQQAFAIATSSTSALIGEGASSTDSGVATASSSTSATGNGASTSTTSASTIGGSTSTKTSTPP